MIGKCQLCLLEKSLCKSHIIPEFMYLSIYDEVPRTFTALTVNTHEIWKSTRRIEQKGKREFLFCKECESVLSKFEKYSSESIFGEAKYEKYIKKRTKVPDLGYYLCEFQGFNSEKLRKFLLSLLFRMLISETFQTPKIGEKYIETIRNAIILNTKISFNDFGCLIQVLTSNSRRVRRFIHGPFETYNFYTPILNILIDGFQFSYYLCESENIKDDAAFFFLKEDGTLNIIEKDIASDPTLVEKLKIAFNFYENK